MHEPLITRNDVRFAAPENRHLIFNRRNTCLVHHRCHMKIIGHGGDNAVEACVRNLVHHEGFGEVRLFLVECQIYFPKVAEFALRRFDEIIF